MTTKRTNSDQFQLRLPPGLRDRIREAAGANNRSMNAEIVARLEASLGAELLAQHDENISDIYMIVEDIVDYIDDAHGSGNWRRKNGSFPGSALVKLLRNHDD